MSYKKVKSENYAVVGGINQKVSLYKTGDTEVLDLVNLDFSEPGAWTSRWGFTNSLISGNTLTIGASQTVNAIWQVIPGIPPNAFATSPAEPGSNTSPRTLFGHNTGIFKITTAISTTFIYDNLITGLTGANWNYVNYRNQSYFSSGTGQTFYSVSMGATVTLGAIPSFKYSPRVFGSNFINDEAAFFGLPQAQGALSASIVFTGATVGPITIANGTYSYQYAYVDRFGFMGPRSATFTVGLSHAQGINTVYIFGMTLANSTSFGVSERSDIYGENLQDLAFFRDKVPGFPSTDMVFIGSLLFPSNDRFPDSQNYTNPFFIEETPVAKTFQYPMSENLALQKYLEVYQNRLFACGDDNKVLFSETDNLQLFFPESFILVGDSKFTVTGMKSYNQGLMFFLRKGLERLTGDSPDNFNKQTITNEYGCISSKAIVEFQERLWFLDDDGVYEYNGATVSKVSSRMDDTFSYMNVSAAVQRAHAIHYKERNEVWFHIPINGATINNIVVVYDYQANAWTTFKAQKLKSTAMASIYTGFTMSDVTKSLENKTYIFGSIGASLYNFSASLTGDDGAGLTLSFRTKFHDAGGSKSSTAQFRRFFLDAKFSSGNNQINGQTVALSFYANYVSNTISLTLPLGMTTFTENRVEFGIPAKSLAAEVAFGASTNMRVNFYGYTIESRYQRSV